MSEHKTESSVSSVVLYAGWLVAVFVIGVWFGYFLKLPDLSPTKTKKVKVVRHHHRHSTPQKAQKRKLHKVQPKVANKAHVKVSHSSKKATKISAQPSPKKRAQTPPPKKRKKPVMTAQKKQKVPTSKPVIKVVEHTIRVPAPTSQKGTASPSFDSHKKFYTAADMPGIAFNRLDPAKRRLAIKLFNTLKQPCGCGQTIAQCAVSDLSCPQVQRTIDVLLNAIFKGEKEKKAAELVENSKITDLSQPQEQEQQPTNQPKSGVVYKIDVKGAPSKGPKDAKLTLVLFSDFQCPYCARAHESIDAFIEQFGKKNVRVVYRHFPLDFHPYAKLAAEAAMCAHAQGKFWEYHDKLFANQEQLDKKHLIQFAKELKLDVARFKKDLESHKYRKIVEKDLAFATQLSIPGTPSFFINGLPVNDNDTLSSVGNEALKRANALLKKGIPLSKLYEETIKNGRLKP